MGGVNGKLVRLSAIVFVHRGCGGREAGPTSGGAVNTTG